MKGMATCKVCGRDFPLLAEDHYEARDPEKSGVIPALSGKEEAIRYDAFDCPHCGCQNIVQVRKIEACPCDFGICDECDHPGEDKEVYTGCDTCKYESRGEDEIPCNECIHCKPDKETDMYVAEGGK